MEMDVNDGKERRRKRLIEWSQRTGLWAAIILPVSLAFWKIGLLGKLPFSILTVVGALLLICSLIIAEIYG